jgi:hypothetical protein
MMFACSVSLPACAVFALTFAASNFVSSVAQGAPHDQTLRNIGISLGVGLLSAGASGFFDASQMVSIIGGSASAAATTAIIDLADNGSLGWNVLESAAYGAGAAALGWGLGQALRASQASLANASDELELYTLKGKGDLGSDTGGWNKPLKVDQATLDAVFKGTVLQGRTRIDPTLAGTIKLAVTNMYGQVRFSPDAFADESLLRMVGYHESIHVLQIAAGNWHTSNETYAKLVNEVEAYRKQIAYSYGLKQSSALEVYRGQTMDVLASALRSLEGTQYWKQVSQRPYNYELEAADKCPPSVCYLK